MCSASPCVAAAKGGPLQRTEQPAALAKLPCPATVSGQAGQGGAAQAQRAKGGQGRRAGHPQQRRQARQRGTAAGPEACHLHRRVLGRYHSHQRRCVHPEVERALLHLRAQQQHGAHQFCNAPQRRRAAARNGRRASRQAGKPPPEAAGKRGQATAASRHACTSASPRQPSPAPQPTRQSHAPAAAPLSRCSSR